VFTTWSPTVIPGLPTSGTYETEVRSCDCPLVAVQLTFFARPSCTQPSVQLHTHLVTLPLR
jgi:hypothetical protein